VSRPPVHARVAAGDPSAEEQKRVAVRDMFGRIAPRYDFLNHFLSGNIDRVWRRRCLREMKRRLRSTTARTLDIGCGTADLSLEFSALGPVVGCDFCHPMLRIGLGKARRNAGRHPVELLEGDALRLPFTDGRFDAVVSAFVLRNLSNLESGLREMRRMLRPGGMVGVLDFAMPRTRLVGPLYRFYFTRVLPMVGRLVSGVDGPYKYLPDSVQAFPEPEALGRMLERCGFREAQVQLLTGGIAVLLTAEAAPE
jgi:demethylmenaquinone methyltransferase / 2-methoxy-6-polyprenyl-1,4-benzoquinol methylase